MRIAKRKPSSLQPKLLIVIFVTVALFVQARASVSVKTGPRNTGVEYVPGIPDACKKDFRTHQPRREHIYEIINSERVGIELEFLLELNSACINGISRMQFFEKINLNFLSH